MRRRSSDGLFNGFTMLFLGLTAVVLIYVVLLLTKVIGPPASLAPQSPTLPSILLVPSSTPTPTLTLTPLPSNTVPPTATTVPTKTKTPTPTSTNTPTLTSTPTITDIPTKTLTPTKTPLPTKTLTPTIDPNLPTKTPTGFPFRLQEGSPQLIANLDAAVGCSFQGVGGQIFDMNNQGAANIQIHVTSTNGFNQTTMSGSKADYGPGGWQIQIGVQPTNGRYTVQLTNPQGVALSPKVNITFSGTCDQNLALVNFFQTRPY